MVSPSDLQDLTREERKRLVLLAVEASAHRHTGTPASRNATVSLAEDLYEFMKKKVTGA